MSFLYFFFFEIKPNFPGMKLVFNATDIIFNFSCYGEQINICVMLILVMEVNLGGGDRLGVFFFVKVLFITILCVFSYNENTHQHRPFLQSFQLPQDAKIHNILVQRSHLRNLFVLLHSLS